MKLYFSALLLLATIITTLHAQGTWNQKADFGGSARYGAVAFSIGSKGYIGTGFDLDTFKNDFWEYDTTTNAWAQMANFGGAARYAAAGFSIGMKGYIGTGYSNGMVYKDFWQYDPSLNMWTQKTDFGGTARSGAVGFTIGAWGYIGTGYDNTDFRNDFWQYDPSTDTWAQKIDFIGSGRIAAVGFSIGSKGYIGTGYDGNDVIDFYEYDPNANAWAQKADFAGTARDGAVGLSMAGKGYIGTGGDGLTVTNDFWEYDPSANTWSQKADFAGAPRYGAVGFCIGSKAYIGTGFTNSYDYTNDFWAFTTGCTGITVYADVDNDGYGDISNSLFAADCVVPVGYALNNEDCNDNNAAVNPAATEVCDGIDNNCDGFIDEGLLLVFYADADGDTYGDLNISTLACSQPAGYTPNSTDCDDNNALVHPGATETCNGIDDNCDGQTDEGVQSVFYLDSDNDGYGNAANSVMACSAPVGYVPDNTDCDDANALIHPGATEICNALDDNCDGQTDEGVLLTFYADNDNDGYGDATVTTMACSAPGGFVADNTDCDDANALIHPGATEICNTLDDNCDGQTDEGVLLTFYADNDNDTYGDAAITTMACSAPGGFVADNTDCNDADPFINPGTFEVCNELDDNCNGYIDEGVQSTFYFDNDLDGYGDPANIVMGCSAPSGYVSDNTDCDDNNALVHPGATETCNTVDDNCDGQIDEGLLSAFYSDNDNDGYGNPGNLVMACSAPIGYVTDNTDCDDNNPEVNPAASEICNSIDDNCINGIDEGLAFVVYYQDADADTYGNPFVSDSTCNGAPIGFVADNTDCNDNNPNVHPGAQEITNNGIDDNCNGEVDEFGVGLDDPAATVSFIIFPNPATDQATIFFSLSHSTQVSIKVSDVGGKEIILSGFGAPNEMLGGDHSILLSTIDFPKGVYIIKLITDFGTQIKKLIVQ